MRESKREFTHVLACSDKAEFSNINNILSRYLKSAIKNHMSVPDWYCVIRRVLFSFMPPEPNYQLNHHRLSNWQIHAKYFTIKARRIGEAKTDPRFRHLDLFGGEKEHEVEALAKSRLEDALAEAKLS
jgi:hypothetical protein